LQLVVAGPGAGKTHLFARILSERVGENLAITFINNLVADLQKDLGDLAAVNTFHGFAKSLLHHLGVEGLTSAFDYYPASTAILCVEASWLAGKAVTERQIIRALHELKDASPIAEFLRAADYYNVVGHDDAVYRVVKHLEDHPDDVPARNQIVVDEIQDFNELEMTLVSQLALTSRVLAVGDDDQALYAFKHATPQYIRDLHGGGEYQTFELPYCFRCTEVVIQAVHDVVETAQKKGLLKGRIAKSFWAHSVKAQDSLQFPKIKAVRCSVDTKSSPYPARYIVQQLRSITAADVEEAKQHECPTAMVIGPIYFVRSIERELRKVFPNSVLAISEEPIKSRLLDGYLRLAKDSHSRWGWRLVADGDPPDGLQQAVLEAINDSIDLDGVLPANYREAHLANVSLVKTVMNGEEVPEAEIQSLLDKLGLEVDELKIRLGLMPTPLAPNPDPALPTIAVRTFMGAKGLSALHVFVVGMLNGHFPRNADAISDTEVCELIVALTRTRKQCHLISSRRYADKVVTPSAFYSWIKPDRLEWSTLNKSHFKSQ
jgi:superfamily I DNA/RNA helicase